MLQQIINYFQNPASAVLVVVTLVSLGAVAVKVVFPALKRQGVDAGAVLQTASGVLGVADQVTDALKAAFPNSAAVNMVDRVIDYAAVGVKQAEQLAHTNEIERDKRKEKAVEWTRNALKAAGYEITPEVEKIIAGSVEAAVLAMGHSLDALDSTEGVGLPAGGAVL